MKQLEIVKIIQKNAENEGLTLTQGEVKTLADIFEKSIGEVYETLEVGESTNMFFLKIAKKEQKGRSGVSTLRGESVEFNTPDKIKLVIKAKDSFADKHTVEK